MSSATTGGHLEERELVSRARDGDREAFGLLAARYQKMIFALAQRMTGSADEAADVLQSCLLNAFRQIRAFRGEASFRTWLYGIALNECRLLHRRSARLVALEAVPEPAARSPGGHPLDRVVLRKLVARLPEKQRAALVLRVCDDLPFREIGALIGTSEVAAKVNYFHAVKKLRRWMAPATEGADEAGEAGSGGAEGSGS